MEKNDVFTFTNQDGTEITAIVIDCLGMCNFEEGYDFQQWDNKYLCYANNKLFYHIEWTRIDKVIDDDFVPSCDEENDWFYAISCHSHDVKTIGSSQNILVNYCVLPNYDTILKEYQRRG